MNSLLEMKNVSKKYKGVSVLEDINLTINKGDILAVTGENGSGKSTLLKLLAGINMPTSGRAIQTKENITLGFVPDLFPGGMKCTVREYITVMGEVSGLPKAVIQQELETLLIRFHLETHAAEYIHTFSKGMKQKVNIMQGIIHNPDLLILDEPLSGLDHEAQQEMKNIIESLHKSGMTIMFTSHEKELIKDVPNRVITLAGGSIVVEQHVHHAKQPKVKITFSMEASPVKEELLDDNKGKTGSMGSSIFVDEKESDNVLKKILDHQGSVHEVTGINEGESFC